MRRRVQPLIACLFVVMVVAPVGARQRDVVRFDAAGPFLFGTGAIRPTYMDAFKVRPMVKSPDGKVAVTVTGPEESYRAFVTVADGSGKARMQVWPIERNIAVLWRPDSQACAFMDNRYANASYALVCSTILTCRAEALAVGGEPEPGPAMIDLTPVVREAFEQRAQPYYKGHFDTRLFYAKVLKWIGGDQLLVGVSGRTVGSAKRSGEEQREWDFAYVVKVPTGRIVREVDKEDLLREYGIRP